MIRELIQSMEHPSEIIAMLRLKLGGFDLAHNKEPLDVVAEKSSDKYFCYAALNAVSRSFAVVIQQLPEELKDPVCVFYLVLRGLDSIEDDMTYPREKRLPLLRNFHAKLYQEGWNISGVGDQKDYRLLLENFDKVIRVFKKLDPAYKNVIADICERMGNGMADYAERSVTTLEDYNEYCFYVAGLVGIGLSNLFSASGLESPELQKREDLSRSMGLLLQKTNISRDYYEDLSLGRAFWPKEVWGKYSDNLELLHNEPESKAALACLNELVTDALQHVSNCVIYLNMIRHPQVFRFCAIPQVMALATLAKIYNNPNVFTEVVKIRKGIAAKMMLYMKDMNSVRKAMLEFVGDIHLKLDPEDPNFLNTKKALNRITEALDEVKWRDLSILPPRLKESGVTKSLT
ncbi:MAG: hypothetical protein KatS3mg031_2365 [Chitinophagales bacterium]|nr:MAG: hypothetical protein KatS3mg031_2365 [Chitinophagales bacterium]